MGINPATDRIEQANPLVGECRIQLDCRCAGPEFGNGITGAGNPTDPDDRYPAPGERMDPGENPGGAGKQRGAGETAGFRTGQGSQGRPMQGCIGRDKTMHPMRQGHPDDIAEFGIREIGGQFDKQGRCGTGCRAGVPDGIEHVGQETSVMQGTV